MVHFKRKTQTELNKFIRVKIMETLDNYLELLQSVYKYIDCV